MGIEAVRKPVMLSSLLMNFVFLIKGYYMTPFALAAPAYLSQNFVLGL